MRISEERQASRLRMTKLKLAFHDAILAQFPEGAEEADLTEAEVQMVLAEMLYERQNRIVCAETPLEDEDV